MKYFQEEWIGTLGSGKLTYGSAGADWNQWAWIWPIIMVRFILTEQKKRQMGTGTLLKRRTKTHKDTGQLLVTV
jgi:hypothetical protein